MLWFNFSLQDVLDVILAVQMTQLSQILRSLLIQRSLHRVLCFLLLGYETSSATLA